MSANILIVEDEGIVAKELEKRLNRLGYQIAGTVATGEEAIASAEELKPDLILMDIRLGGALDGVETARQINRRLDVPVVYLTAYADSATVERATAAHAYGYILKPFREQELAITTEIALHQHRRERELTEKICQIKEMGQPCALEAGPSPAGQKLEALAENLAALNQIEEDNQAFNYQLLQSVMQLAGSAAHSAILFELDNATGQFELQQQYGPQKTPARLNLPLTNPYLAQVISHKKGLVVDFVKAAYQTGLELDWSGQGAGATLPQAALVLPLVQEEQALSLVVVYINLPAPPAGDMLALLQTFTLLAGVSRQKITNFKHKEDFLAMTAHDLRAPLAAIHLSAGILQTTLTQQPLANPLLQLVDNINRNSLRLRKLVDDLLDLNRLNQGCIQLHLEYLPITELVTGTIGTLATLFEEKQQIVLYEPPATECRVRGDRQRLEQVLVNLLTNAHKYTPAGGRLVISVEASEAGIEISISDNGPGIPPEEQVHIFDQFYRCRLHESVNSLAGSGLGLPIARRLAELQGGKLWLKSSNTDPDKGPTGSTFALLLPLLAEPANPN